MNDKALPEDPANGDHSGTESIRTPTDPPVSQGGDPVPPPTAKSTGGQSSDESVTDRITNLESQLNEALDRLRKRDKVVAADRAKLWHNVHQIRSDVSSEMERLAKRDRVVANDRTKLWKTINNRTQLLASKVRALESNTQTDTKNQTGASKRRDKRKTDERLDYYVDLDKPQRRSPNEMVETLSEYDVISFDIFDTALIRAVASPIDVFRIMGSILGVTDFAKKRKEAEDYARRWKDRLEGTREVSLDDIYQVLKRRHGATAEWIELEKQIEIRLARADRYTYKVYEQLRSRGKRIVFTSDMYLPLSTIETMLEQCGYDRYEKIYLSNELAARKGDGTLQPHLLKDFNSKRIVHIGDVYESDVAKTVEVGIDAVHNPSVHRLIPGVDMGSLSGSFYQAVVDSSLCAGDWNKSLYYTHGYRTGGILTLGYVEFIENLAIEKNIDHILFLGRDCDIISKSYSKYYNNVPSTYVDISRLAVLGLVTDREYDDFLGRTFFRWFRESNNTRPLSQLLTETGFGYLVDYLEHADIEPLQFPMSANEQRLREFFWAHKTVVEEHLAESRDAARDYFLGAIGDAQRILAVDVGWTGTCITALRHFMKKSSSCGNLEVLGALLATSRTQSVTDAVSDGTISAFVYSPAHNLDISRRMMPGGRKPQREKDLSTHPVEYLFTEPVATAVRYEYGPDGSPRVVRGDNRPPNADQIIEMQQGISDFIDDYRSFSSGFEDIRTINSYVAFQPLRNALNHRPYLYSVYKDFLYDAAPVLHGGDIFERFGDLFDPAEQRIANTDDRYDTNTQPNEGRRILFISPEMIYAGAPRSLLRLCRVARDAGYVPMVWTAKPGPFMKEFHKSGISVQVFSPKDIGNEEISDLLADGVELVVANTIATDEYVRALEGRIPMVWYIREATNIPDFLVGNNRRADTLRQSRSVVVVSDYAADAVRPYTDGPVKVVRNAVEDVSHVYGVNEPRTETIFKFVQLGTIEHRKGYDVLIAAYKSLPERYRALSEIHFAGGFINSATGYASLIFGEIADFPGISYHGQISDERDKVALLASSDVVVVASRDESCSLVALEGAMMSKPLVVTDNVGANYMVSDDSGLIVRSGDVASLRDALITLIDRGKSTLREMGTASRAMYSELASMAVHKQELSDLFRSRIESGPEPVKFEPVRAPAVIRSGNDSGTRELVVSLTSHPPRMSTITSTIRSLQSQTRRPDRIQLWLSEDQFPRKEADLPDRLLDLLDGRFDIRWVQGDLRPHKKYFHTMQENRDSLIITVDDDVQYDPSLVETLYDGHLESPNSVIAARSNLIRFRPNGELRTYDQWGYDHRFLLETDTYTLLPTGIGGILYPPGAIPEQAFNEAVISNTCLSTDDLWLKMMATANGYPVWMPRRKFGYKNIDGSQTMSLWRTNAFHGENDDSVDRILEYLDREFGVAEEVLHRLRGVRADGTAVGRSDVVDRTSLFSPPPERNRNN